MTTEKEISKYKLDLVGLQEVRWDRGGTEPAGEYTFFYGKGNENNKLDTGFFERVEFVSDRMSYIIKRCRWCDIVFPNVHAKTENKIDDVEDSFYEELKCVFNKFPKYHTKILFVNFNAKVGREDIFKPTNGSDSLHEINDDNRIRVVRFATSKN
jgi:hypothetical protein